MRTQYIVGLSLLAGVTLGAAMIQSLHAQAKSKAYIITEVEIIDQEAFNEFSPKVAEATEADGGTYLARGGKVMPLEGQPPKRVIVTVYDSLEKAEASRSSAAWKAITPLREKATKTRSYIVEGL
jgi:uncharacterized protein (DUF1330 family)